MSPDGGRFWRLVKELAHFLKENRELRERSAIKVGVLESPLQLSGRKKVEAGGRATTDGEARKVLQEQGALPGGHCSQPVQQLNLCWHLG